MSRPTDVVALPSVAHRTLQALVCLGALTFGVGLLMAPHRIWADALLSSYFMLELSLAAMVFVALHDVSGATWDLAIRRVPEAMARLLPLGAIGVAFVLVMRPDLYPWFGTAPPDSGASAFKHLWLNRAFFLTRSTVYLVCWIAFALAFARVWRREEHGPRARARLSAGFLVAVGVTLVPASFDWIMSLEPAWYSTIFGFYEFASMFAGGIAAILAFVIWIWRLAPDAMAITEEHLHDLGKLLFAFSTFWAYIWFCQYMLIWYTNIPDETSYFIERQSRGWMVLFWLNLALNWVAPFFILLSQHAKIRPTRLLAAAVAVLLGRLADLSLAVLPRFVGARPILAVLELGVIAGAVGLFALAFFWTLERQAPGGGGQLARAGG